MKSICKSLVMMLVCGVMTMLPISQAVGQSLPEPAIVVSIAKFKEQMNDVNYLLTASGFPEMKFMAGAMVKGYTKGLDEGKDGGVLLYLNEDSDEPDFLGFVPVKDIEEMLDVISGFAEVDEGDDYTTIVPDNGPEILIKEHKGYAFISNKSEMFTDLPGDPGQWLGKLPTDYNLAAKVFVQRIPEKMRDQVMEMIRSSSEETFDNFDDDLQTDIQRKNLELQMKQVEMVFKEADTFTFGMTADKDAKAMVMDIEFKGLPNSELASKLIASKATAPSRFTGFLMDGATFTTNNCAKVSAEDAKQYSKMISDLKDTAINEMDQDGDMSEQELELVKNSLGNIVDVVNETLAEGLIDFGGVLMLEDGNINAAFGGQISDPRKIEKTVKELIAMGEEKMGEDIEVNLNSGSHKNITLHEIVVQVPDEEEEVRDAIGDQIKIVLGIGTKEVYVAVGSNPVDLLKKAVDGTHMAKEMAQYNIYVTPILKFAAGMEGDPNMETMADALAKAGNDRVSMTTDLIDNGLKIRFEMQDGILGLIKVGFEAFQGGGGGGFPTDDF